MSDDGRLVYVVIRHFRIHLSIVRLVQQVDVYTELYTNLHFRIRTVQYDTSDSSYYVAMWLIYHKWSAVV